MDAPPLVAHMMHSVRTVPLCSCRHASAASQCPRAPEPPACLLSRCLVDYLPHGATGAVRLERYRRHGWQCCRHVETATAACTAQVPDLSTPLWTSVFGCGVLFRSLSNTNPVQHLPKPCKGNCATTLSKWERRKGRQWTALNFTRGDDACRLPGLTGNLRSV